MTEYPFFNYEECSRDLNVLLFSIERFEYVFDDYKNRNNTDWTKPRNPPTIEKVQEIREEAKNKLDKFSHLFFNTYYPDMLINIKKSNTFE